MLFFFRSVDNLLQGAHLVFQAGFDNFEKERKNMLIFG